MRWQEGHNHNIIKFHNCWVGDSQTGEHLYHRSPPTGVKVLSPTSGFQTWGSGNGRRNSQRIRLWRLAGFDCRTLTGLRETETPLLEGTHKVVCTSGTRERSSDPIGDWTRPTCYCWRVSCRGGRWLCLTVRTRTVAAEILGSTPWHEPSQSPPLAPPKSPGRLQCWVASGQTTNREGIQPHPSPVKWIKLLLSSAHQSNSQLYPAPVPPIRKLAQAS